MLKKCNRGSGSTLKLRLRMLLVWLISLMIPIILLASYNYVIYGPKAFRVFTNREFFNKEVWQMDRYNSTEYVANNLNKLILKDPESVLDSRNYENVLSEEDIINYEIIIIIRRNDKLIAVNDMNTVAGQEVIQNMQKLDNHVLPKFMGDRNTNNRELFLQTGYVVSRQTDFYFKNGDEGSIFMLRKFTNIPAKFIQVLTQNIIFIIIITIIMQTIFFYKMAKNITRPIEDLIVATNQVRDGNFGYRMKSHSKGILNDLILAINDMIIDLDDGQRYRRQIDETRKEFIANISHDLKTPMTSIKIHVDAIRDGIVNTPEKMDRYLANIQKKVSDMDSMLEELKTFSELETGIGNYSLNKLDFGAVIEDIIDEFRYDVSNDFLKLNYFADLSRGKMVEIDVEKMKRVVLNIIVNSMKYAKSKPIIIDINLKNIDYNESRYIEMSIKDNGIGVSKEKLDKIFEKFYRGDEARNQDQMGSGLGLAIAKTIVEQHGGNIKAISDIDKGLEIVITLNTI